MTQTQMTHADLAAMDGFEQLSAFTDGRLPAAPIADTLGMTNFQVERGTVSVELTVEPRHYNPIGSVHGGYAATLLDSALACAIHSTLPAGAGYTTAELKVNLVRPISADTGELRCEANVIHVGRRVATAEAKLTDANGKLYAHGTTTCLIL